MSAGRFIVHRYTDVPPPANAVTPALVQLPGRPCCSYIRSSLFAADARSPGHQPASRVPATRAITITPRSSHRSRPPDHDDRSIGAELLKIPIGTSMSCAVRSCSRASRRPSGAATWRRGDARGRGRDGPWCGSACRSPRDRGRQWPHLRSARANDLPRTRLRQTTAVRIRSAPLHLRSSCATGTLARDDG